MKVFGSKVFSNMNKGCCRICGKTHLRNEDGVCLLCWDKIKDEEEKIK
jgi:hypothetical protein